MVILLVSNIIVDWFILKLRQAEEKYYQSTHTMWYDDGSMQNIYFRI